VPTLRRAYYTAHLLDTIHTISVENYDIRKHTISDSFTVSADEVTVTVQMNNEQSRPHCLEGTSDAALQCTQYVHARLADKSRETNGKPVDNVAAVNSDEINKRIDKHSKDFGVRIVKHSRENIRDALQL